MSEKQHGFWCGWLPVFLWMLVIFTLSSIPGDNLPKVPVPSINSLVHAVEYSVLGALMLRGFLHSMPGKRVLAVAIFAILASLLFAASDEWHQTFVPGRFCDLEDIIVDAIASVLGVLAQIRIGRHPPAGKNG